MGAVLQFLVQVIVGIFSVWAKEPEGKTTVEDAPTPLENDPNAPPDDALVRDILRRGAGLSEED